MRRASGLLFAIFLLAATTAIAGSTSIGIDGVEGVMSSPNGYVAVAGGLIKFHIRYTNLTDTGWIVTNAFRLTSPDGATWTDSALGGNFHGTNLGPLGVDTTGNISKWQFPTGYFLRSYNDDTATTRADGFSPDVISFEAIGADFGQGLLPQTDVRHFSILVQTNAADTGRTICLDSVTKWKCCQTWKWSGLWQVSGESVNSAQAQPGWGGPVCISLVSSSALATPIIANCPEPLTGGHCAPVSHDFDAIAPGGNPIDVRYKLWDSPGNIDSMTGLWTGEGLVPGEYALAVNARNVTTGVYSITCWANLDVPNQPPVFSAEVNSIPASVGQLSTFTPHVSNDCDALTFRFVHMVGEQYVMGDLSLDSTTGLLSFTPVLFDSTVAPIDRTIEVTDGYACDTTVVVWHFAVTCSGTAGNINCDGNESVDVGDLTTLIDNLFIMFTPLCSPGEANCDGDSEANIDVGDLTALIDNLFITFTPLPACP